MMLMLRAECRAPACTRACLIDAARDIVYDNAR